MKTLINDHIFLLGGEGAVLGASNSDQTTDTSAAQKTAPATSVSMATMMLGG